MTAAFNWGHSPSHIASFYNITLRQVNYTLRQENFTPRRRTGRPSILSSMEIEEVIALITQNANTRRLSYEEILNINQHYIH